MDRRSVKKLPLIVGISILMFGATGIARAGDLIPLMDVALLQQSGMHHRSGVDSMKADTTMHHKKMHSTSKSKRHKHSTGSSMEHQMGGTGRDSTMSPSGQSRRGGMLDTSRGTLGRGRGEVLDTSISPSGKMRREGGMFDTSSMRHMDSSMSPSGRMRRGGMHDTLEGMRRNGGILDTTLSPSGRERRGSDTSAIPHDMEHRSTWPDSSDKSSASSPQNPESRRGGILGGDSTRRQSDTSTAGGRSTMGGGMTSRTPRMTARLVDKDVKAQKMEAAVRVSVEGVRLVDPSDVNEHANPGEAHIHYRIDDGPVIATTSTKLSFHGLTSGQHKIMVMLAGNDHTQLGPQEMLTVTIP